jgi:hypothetical protein
MFRRNRKARRPQIPRPVETAVITLSMYDAYNLASPGNLHGETAPGSSDRLSPEAGDRPRQQAS